MNTGHKAESVDMQAFHNAIVGDNAKVGLKSPQKGRQRTPSGRPVASPQREKENSNLLTTANNNNNYANYDTDDQTDQMMDMLVKSATAIDKRTRIRKNRAKEGKTTRKSGMNLIVLPIILRLFHVFSGRPSKTTFAEG